ncbi:MAG: hypothetical protein GYB50_03875 [Rhodobacteraceae bacterium]|nr:hypothetical protein [Paracoccaceae bacterium]
MSSLMLCALALYAAAAVADVITTVRGLERGGVEANPVIRWFMERLGHGWIVFKLALTAAIAFYAVSHGYVAVVFVLAVITGLVAWHNTRVV